MSRSCGGWVWCWSALIGWVFRCITGGLGIMLNRFNPGSDAARDAGCICPEQDNNYGKWAPWPPDGWWLRQDCPYHFPDGAKREVGEAS